MILADMVNDFLNVQGIYPQTVTASVQGGAQDMSQTELSTNAVINASVQTLANLTAATVQLEECATTNGTFTLIPGTQVSITGTNAAANLLQVVRGLRTLRYARVNAITFAAGTVTGALALGATIHGLKKISPNVSGSSNYPSSSPPSGS